MSWLHYLVEANLYLGIFYLFYYLFLIKETHYTLNRAYLLVSCAISFAIPMIQLGWLKPAQTVTQTTAIAVVNDNSYILTDVLVSGYIIGVIVAIVSLGIKLYKLQQLARSHPSLSQDSYKLIFMEESTTAFSFFNYLFIGTDTLEPEMITRHELVHIRQKHSIDIMLLELFKIINWFNPVVYLLQASLKTLHEYIADEKTAETDLFTYATFLVNNAYGVSGSAITHSFFNYNLLKKRIIMLNQQRSGKLARLKYLTALPICAAMLCASTLAFSKTYGYTAFAANNVTDTVKKKIVQKADKHPAKVTDIKISEPEVKSNKTSNTKGAVKIADVKLLPPPPPPAPPVAAKKDKKNLPPPPPPAAPVTKQNKNVLPPPPPAPPVSKSAGHKSPPPPPAPPANTKQERSKTKVVDQVKFPPPVVKPAHGHVATKTKIVDQVKFPPPVVKSNNE